VVVVHPGPAPRPMPAAPYFVGEPVEVAWGASWYPAHVTYVLSVAAFRVHYDGWSDSWDEVVGPDRIRPLGRHQSVPPPPPFVMNNLVVNGGFESPGLATGSWSVYQAIPGWFVTRGSGIEVQASVAGSPFEGRQHVELDAEQPTEIAQDVRVIPGAMYQLSVAFSARPGTPWAENRATVFFDDEPVISLAADGRQLGDTAWQVYSATVVARQHRGRITIRYEGRPDGVGAYIDDVRFVRVR